MAKMQRISRSRKRELIEPDQFISRTARVLDLLARHRRNLLLGLAVLAAVAAGLLGVRYFSQQAEMRAHAEYSRLLTRQAALGPAAPAEQVLQELEGPFRDLVDRHGGRLPGQMALLALADLYFRAGQLDKALAAYRRLQAEVPPSRYAHWAATNGAAYTQAAQGQGDEALAAFEKLASGPEAVFRADALFQAGRLYAARGDAAKSRETFQRLLAEYPGYVYAEMLQARMEG
jgi:tetratricopeptide (TPR) repeat protein